MDNIFNETVSNVLSNYVPHEPIICDDQYPQWINNKVKKAIQEKSQPLAVLSQILIIALFWKRFNDYRITTDHRT